MTTERAQRGPTGLGGTTPEEICRAIHFILASPAMTGQMVALDGGKHLGWLFPDQDDELAES